MDELLSRASRTRRLGGLSLVELMIALAVLSVGLVGMLSMQTDALRGSRHGRHVSEGARVAEEQMELLQRLPWAAIPPSGWSAPRTVTGPMNGAGPGQAQSYLVSARVTLLDGVKEMTTFLKQESKLSKMHDQLTYIYDNPPEFEYLLITRDFQVILEPSLTVTHPTLRRG